VASATVQTTDRQPLLIASGPTATIAMAGSQYRMKTRHRLDRMSCASQVVMSDFILRTAASVRSRQFYNLECSPESSGIVVESLATRKQSPISQLLAPASAVSPSTKREPLKLCSPADIVGAEIDFFHFYLRRELLQIFPWLPVGVAEDCRLAEEDHEGPR